MISSCDLRTVIVNKKFRRQVTHNHNIYIYIDIDIYIYIYEYMNI